MTAISYVPDLPAARVHASLRQSLQALEMAQQCAVLWFAEIMLRHLYREFDCASINQYAMKELGFSKTRTGDFIRLARQLEKLPAVREAMSTGDLGYTKAREIVGVATPETQDDWLAAAKRPRKELIREVKRVKNAAKVDPGQGELLPAKPTVVAPKELPVRFQIDLTPEQEARRAALVERLHKLGEVPTDRGEFLLEALAVWVESKEKAPRGALASASSGADSCSRTPGSNDRRNRSRRTGFEPGGSRTHALRCRDMPTWKTEHDHHSATRQKGGPGPRSASLPGAWLQQNEVPRSPPHRRPPPRRNQPSGQPGDPVRILPPAVA